jgi:hypothetical protein
LLFAFHFFSAASALKLPLLFLPHLGCNIFTGRSRILP